MVCPTLPIEAFLSRRERKDCRNCVKSLLSMRGPLLGDSFKPRLSLDRTPGAILIFVLKARFWPLPCHTCNACAAQTGLTGVTCPETCSAATKRLHTISAEPLLFVLRWILERLYSHGEDTPAWVWKTIFLWKRVQAMFYSSSLTSLSWLVNMFASPRFTRWSFTFGLSVE